MLRFIGISFFCVDLIIMKFVLSLLIDSLLISHHLFTLASSEFIECSSVLGSLADANTFVSSAKILKLNFCELFGKSLM